MTSEGTEPLETDGARYERVVIPLANPATAALLIRLGKALTDPVDGHLLLITVITGEAEAESSADSIDELREIVEAESDERFELELDARTAPAIARGILDYSREQNADLIVLGVGMTKDGDFSPINEAVMEAAHCGVLAVRPGSDRD
ncbi:MAG TPA: universal stress protein [Acidimicrobiia bacterium]